LFSFAIEIEASDIGKVNLARIFTDATDQRGFSVVASAPISHAFDIERGASSTYDVAVILFFSFL
jgi:hypothetical protein